MMRLEDSYLPFDQCFSSCFIEPVRQKQFKFDIEEPGMSMQLHNKKPARQTHQWAPVLSYKKLYDDPKLLLSMERKKARIVSSIRDRQVQECQQSTKGLHGRKLRNKSLKSQTRTQSNFQLNVEAFVESNENKLNKIQFKQKKNPYMNVSLLYMSERKRNLNTDSYNKAKTSCSFNTTSHREKGSDNPYLHMIMFESTQKKERIRPKTSCTTERHRKIQRPISQIG